MSDLQVNGFLGQGGQGACGIFRLSRPVGATFFEELHTEDEVVVLLVAPRVGSQGSAGRSGRGVGCEKDAPVAGIPAWPCRLAESGASCPCTARR